MYCFYQTILQRKFLKLKFTCGCFTNVVHLSNYCCKFDWWLDDLFRKFPQAQLNVDQLKQKNNELVFSRAFCLRNIEDHNKYGFHWYISACLINIDVNLVWLFNFAFKDNVLVRLNSQPADNYWLKEQLFDS